MDAPAASRIYVYGLQRDVSKGCVWGITADFEKACDSAANAMCHPDPEGGYTDALYWRPVYDERDGFALRRWVAEIPREDGGLAFIESFDWDESRGEWS